MIDSPPRAVPCDRLGSSTTRASASCPGGTCGPSTVLTPFVVLTSAPSHHVCRVYACSHAIVWCNEPCNEPCNELFRYNVPEDKRLPCGGEVCIKNNVSTAANKDLARKLSAMSTVLLKNDGGLLPLDKASVGKIALIGLDAGNTSYTAGKGSGGVKNSNVAVSPVEAFARLGLDVVYEPAATVHAAVKAASKKSGDVLRLGIFLDFVRLTTRAEGPHGTRVRRAKRSRADRRSQSMSPFPFQASSADVAIIFGSAHSGEGHDRLDLLFYNDPEYATTEDVIAAVGAVQPKTVRHVLERHCTSGARVELVQQRRVGGNSIALGCLHVCAM